MIARALPRCAATVAGAAIALAFGLWATDAAADRSGGLLPVPAVSIAKGEEITAQKLTEKHFYFDPTRPLSVITDPAAAIGKAARRHLVAGKPIPLNAFTTLEVVKRGRLVQARYVLGTLSIDATVLAQESGGVGDLIRARNLDSGRTVTGIVTAEGTLRVGGQ